MTQKQQWRYWKLWQLACKARGWDQADNEHRHSLHTQALGYDVSHKDMDNREVDRVYKALELAANPDNLDAVLFFQNPEREEKKRLLWRIEQTAPGPYIKAISTGKFGTMYYHDLDLGQLEQLRNTLKNRMRAKQKKQAANAAPVMEAATSQEPAFA